MVHRVKKSRTQLKRLSTHLCRGFRAQVGSDPSLAMNVGMLLGHNEPYRTKLVFVSSVMS